MWLRKHYGPVCGLILFAVLIGWTGFWNHSSDVFADALTETDKALEKTAADSQNAVPGTDTQDGADNVDYYLYSDSSENNDSITIQYPDNSVKSADAGVIPGIDSDAVPENPLGDCSDYDSGANSVEDVSGPNDADIDNTSGNVPDTDVTENSANTDSSKGSENANESGDQPQAFTFAYCIANVNEKLNVRSGPGENNAIVAGMMPNSYAEILERGEEWTKIKSGSVTGYASNKYLLFDMDAVERLERLNVLYVKITANTVNVRSASNTDSKVLRQATLGQKYIYLPEKDVEGWHCVQYSETDVAYISSQYSSIFIDLKTAEPVS